MRNICVLFLATLPLFAQEKPADNLRSEKKQTLDFPAGGLLRVKDSTGELTIETWGKPSVELTTVKSAKYMLSTKDREKAAAELERITVTAQRHGSELDVTTTAPRRTGKIDISYHLFVPRDTRLEIQHRTGDVNIEGAAAAVDAKLRSGEIFLYLPEGVPYSIQAKSAFGSINAPGDPALKPEHLHLGESLTQNAPGQASKLNLKVDYGDIYIMRQTQSPSQPKAQ